MRMNFCMRDTTKSIEAKHKKEESEGTKLRLNGNNNNKKKLDLRNIINKNIYTHMKNKKRQHLKFHENS